MVSEYDGQLSEYQQYGWGISGNNRSIIQASARPYYLAPRCHAAGSTAPHPLIKKLSISDNMHHIPIIR
jgi:hypothetical protein